jgi:hypothetical protein
MSYRYSRNSFDEAIVPAKVRVEFGLMPGEKADCYISCPLQADPGHEQPPPDAVSLLNGAKEEMHIPVSLEQLRVAEMGARGVAMCVGPIYTDLPQFGDWLTHWSRFDLTGIHAYVPLFEEGVVNDLSQGQPYRRPSMIMHHLLTWTTYFPIERVEYHSQRLMYADCIYRYGTIFYMSSARVPATIGEGFAFTNFLDMSLGRRILLQCGGRNGHRLR